MQNLYVRWISSQSIDKWCPKELVKYKASVQMYHFQARRGRNVVHSYCSYMEEDKLYTSPKSRAKTTEPINTKCQTNDNVDKIIAHLVEISLTGAPPHVGELHSPDSRFVFILFFFFRQICLHTTIRNGFWRRAAKKLGFVWGCAFLVSRIRSVEINCYGST